MIVGVVDIGTNSMRLLITGPEGELGRWSVVTGLGRGVDETGSLDQARMAETVEVLGGFGEEMTAADVASRAAMATSATRDAANREVFLDMAEEALGVRPEVIDGSREGELAYRGATAGLDDSVRLVSDIGGGSTEFVTASGSVSIDIGSVRLSDRVLRSRPAPPTEMEAAREHVQHLFADVPRTAGEVVGVAGTWTTLGAMHLDLARYDRALVHRQFVPSHSVRVLTENLADMTVAETAAIPSMDPGRAPMILAGAVIAVCVLDHLGADGVLVSETDTLDGLAMELMGLL